MNRTLKVAFVHNYYIHYRTPFFEMLSNRFDMKYFFTRIYPTVSSLSTKIKFSILQSIDTLSFSPTLLFNLIRDKYYVFISGDALSLNSIVTFIVSKVLNRPFILWEERWFYSHSILHMLLWPFARLIYLKSTSIIVPGSRSRLYLTSLGIDRSKIFVAPNASVVMAEKTSVTRAKQFRKKLPNNGFVVLYLGRLEPVKGLKYLLLAFKKLKTVVRNSALLIVGQGSQKEELVDFCSSYHIDDVVFYGAVTETERSMFFLAADVLVYPSLRETWGMVVNEAMGLGLPVITTPMVGAAWDLIIDGVNGRLVKEGDEETLFRALSELARNSDLRKRMGENAKAYVLRRFSYRTMVNSFVEAIALTLKRK